MSTVSSHELWGVMWCEILILPTSFVTLDGCSSLHGLQFAQLKNRIGNCEMGGAGGSRWQACGRSKENDSSLPPTPASQSHSDRTSGHSDSHSTLAVASRELLSLWMVRPPCAALRMGFVSAHPTSCLTGQGCG